MLFVMFSPKQSMIHHLSQQAVYANMYPSNLRTMVLDGVLDPQGWFNDNAVHDPVYIRVRTDQAAARSLEAFLGACGTAGPEKCAFSDGSRTGTLAKWNNVSLVLSKYGGVGGSFLSPDVIDIIDTLMYSSRQLTRYNNSDAPDGAMLDEYLQVRLMMRSLDPYSYVQTNFRSYIWSVHV